MRNQQKNLNSDQSIDSPIQIRGKKTYGFISRIFCCKCFGCCQEEDRSLLTSNNRKDISKRLISQFKSDKDNAIEDPLQILIRLYIDDSEETIFQLLNKTRINPDLSESHIWRDDLEFYLPQICNFFVFHEELRNDKLKEFLKKAGKIDFYFAHLFCFYLKSVAQTVQKNQVQDIPQVWNMLEEFTSCFYEFYYGKQLMSAEMVESLAMGKKYVVPHKLNKQNIDENSKQKQELISTYGTSYYEKNPISINPEDIKLNNYICMQDFLQLKERVESSNEAENLDNGIPQEKQKLYKEAEINGTNTEFDLKDGFQSTIQFYNDLMEVSENLKFSDPKIVSLRHELQKVNSQLPAAVYVPFFTNNYRNHVILNIVTQECKVFSTKERSPFYICLELYRSEETSQNDANSPQLYTAEKQKNGEYKYKWNYDERLSQPLTVNNQEYQSKHQDIETCSKPSLSKKMYVTDSTMNTNTALLDKKGDNYDENARSMQQQYNTLGESKLTIDVKQSTTTRQLEASKSSAVQNQIRKGANNRSIDLSTNTAPNNRNKSFGENQNPETVSGISCVYEKGMRVPSHYNLKDLEWEVKQELKKAQIEKEEISVNVPINQNNSIENSENNLNITQKNFLDTNPLNTESMKNLRSSNNLNSAILDLNDEKYKGLKSLFGEDTKDQESRIRKNSPFGHFKSWKLVHMIVKTGDNIKQEQFAVQLIYQFDQIFKMEGLDLKLTPYEIASLAPQCGIMEMVKNSITLDGLLKQIHSFKEIKDLHHFFQLYYGSQFKKAQQNFCSSLAAYSLVCYFLQIKDRHNGNILLHKNGHIIHIDFGFFLSNAPGKGLAFEQNVPFKLLSDYTSILGGVDSDMFQTFRMQFFKGFQAACKHQDKILILVKMLYSGHGLTLPCFEKGEQCISDLEARFNPPDIANDGELSMHCNMLINQSLDNWRARCGNISAKEFSIEVFPQPIANVPTNLDQT